MQYDRCLVPVSLLFDIRPGILPVGHHPLIIRTLRWSDRVSLAHRPNFPFLPVSLDPSELVNISGVNMMLRLVLLALLSVGAVAQCQICLYGGNPTNFYAILPDGIYCGYYIENPPEADSCALIRQPVNQILCGCWKPPLSKKPTRKPTVQPGSKPTTKAPTRKPTTRAPTGSKPTTRTPTRKPTTRAPTGAKPTTRTPTRKPTTRSPTRKPTTRSPTVNPGSGCQICVNGGVPKYLSANVGLPCSYFYQSSGILSATSCAFIRMPANQATCGCPGFWGWFFYYVCRCLWPLLSMLAIKRHSFTLICKTRRHFITKLEFLEGQNQRVCCWLVVMLVW